MGTMSAPAGYALLLPPGWGHIPLLAGTEAAVDRILDDRIPAAGGQPPPLRTALRAQLLATAADARRAGGLDLYLLVAPPTTHPVDASLVVTAVPAGPEGVAPSLAELAPLLAGPHTASRVVALAHAGEALRLETSRPGHPGDPLRPATREVQFVVAVPGTANRLMLTFATTTGPVMDELAGLFDAMAGSFGFTAAQPV